jgi:cyclohexyl-isocyanide hydratase
MTGPVEVLSRIPNSTIHVIAKTKSPVRDIQGLILTPEMSIAKAPELDVLLVPGGFGQQHLMNDEEVLSLLLVIPRSAFFALSRDGPDAVTFTAVARRVQVGRDFALEA